LAFWFLFHLSKLVQKLWNFLWWFIGRVRNFTSVFWKILKVLFKKISICEIFFFLSKFCGLLFSLYFFYYFWHFIFQFRPFVLVKKFYKFLCFFILWIRDFIKEFWKIMESFSKKYRHLKSKILHKLHRLLFVFFLFFYHFNICFFSYITYLNLSKNSKHFCGALLYGLYILSEHYGKFLNFY